MIRQDTETKRYTHKVEFFQKKNGATKPDGTPDTKLDMEKVWCQGIPEVHKDAAAMALQSMDCQFDVINKKLWKLLEKDEIDQAEFYGLFHNDHKSDIRHLKKGLVKDVLVSDLPEEYEKTEIRCGNCHHFKTLRMDLKIRARFVKVNGKAHAILIDAKTGKDLDDNGDEEEESDSSKEDEESDSSKDDEDIDSSKDNEDYNDD